MVEKSGCIASPVLSLLPGSFFVLKMRVTTPRRGVLLVQQELFPITNFTAIYDSGNWFYDQGGLESGESRILFNFSFFTPLPNPFLDTIQYAFIVDSISVAGPTLATKPKPPRRIGWRKDIVELVFKASPIVFPAVILFAIFIPACTFLYYLFWLISSLNTVSYFLYTFVCITLKKDISKDALYKNQIKSTDGHFIKSISFNVYSAVNQYFITFYSI